MIRSISLFLLLVFFSNIALAQCRTYTTTGGGRTSTTRVCDETYTSDGAGVLLGVALITAIVWYCYSIDDPRSYSSNDGLQVAVNPDGTGASLGYGMEL